MYSCSERLQKLISSSAGYSDSAIEILQTFKHFRLDVPLRRISDRRQKS